MKRRDTELRLKSVFQITSLLIAKLKTADQEENWEDDRKGFGTPGSMDRVFFSCAACHVGRVVVGGKMKFLPGMPNTEIEAQYYSKLLMLTSRGARRVGLRSHVDDTGESRPPSRQTETPSARCTGRC